MFKFHFKPDFASQRNILLQETEVPNTDLPSYLEDAVQQIANDKKEYLFSQRNLWILCFQVSRPILFKTILAATATALCASTSTLVAMQILKDTSSLNRLFIFSGFYFVLNFLAQAGNFFNNYQRALFGLNIETVLVGLISKKILRLSTSAADEQSSGNLKVLMMSDVTNISQFFNNVARNFIPSCAALIVMSPLLIRFSGVSGAAGLIILSLIIPISLALNTISARVQVYSQTEMDKLVTSVEEWVTNIRLVRYLSLEEAIQRKISSQLKKFMRFASIQHFLACLIFGLSTSWWMITAGGILLFAHLFQYSISLTAFFGSIWLLTFIAGYFTHLPNTIRLFGLALPSVRRIQKFLTLPEQQELFIRDSEPHGVGISHLKPASIIFENVSLAYSDLVLNNVNLTLNLSKKTAILGEIGSGKTSLLRLLTGEIPPTGGQIFVQFTNGLRKPLWNEEAYHCFRNFIGVVPQASYISSDFFSNNISLSDAAAESSIMHAAQLAELTADLEQFPQGLSEAIGEAGVNLSGGQKQRLALARAFFSEREFLILDDTLSAVDANTETKLMANLLSRHHGFVLVTHRLKEIMSLDHVLVMKNGALVETGTPQNLALAPDSFFMRALNAYGVADG